MSDQVSEPVQKLSDPDPTVRNDAIDALADIDSAAVTPQVLAALATALNDPDPDVAAGAIRVLARIDPSDSLDYENQCFRWRTCYSPGHNATLVAATEALSGSPTDEELREAARLVLLFVSCLVLALLLLFLG